MDRNVPAPMLANDWNLAIVVASMRRFINKALWLVVHKIPWKPILIWGPWVIVLLALAFYGIENWRGAEAWRKAQLQAKSQGIKTSYSDFFPEPLSSREAGFSNLPGLGGQSLSNRLDLQRSGTPELNVDRRAHRNIERWKASPEDIRLWLDPSIRPSNKKDAALELERIMKNEFSLLTKTREATTGSTLRFLPASHQFSFSDKTSNVAGRSKLAALARDDALISLALQDSERLSKDILFLFQLAQAEVYPTQMNDLITSAIWGDLEEVVWSAIKERALSHEGLLLILNHLPESFGLDSFNDNVQGQCAWNSEAYDVFKEDRDRLVEQMKWSTSISTGYSQLDEITEKAQNFGYRIMPKGWLDQAKAENLRQALVLAKVADGDFASYIRLASQNEETTKYSLNKILAGIYPQLLRRRTEHFARMELLKIGLHLEIFHLKNGKYPLRFQELGVEFEDDPFANREMNYRLKSDGSPIVWSVGANRIDENGLSAKSKRDGDIVWMLTPTAVPTESKSKNELEQN
ncbi:hypothetical protein [Roseibacillus persicicus]|uniref:hypothetical protein n=1 Tax=Roseibacillus persicicus TaxID=454148 RepID=UPI0028106A1E|nr:hypothetical protein [Roseibacillus persicicus]MDQ8189411.1 hypothetical protein [Roseibacillus persicicus]